MSEQTLKIQKYIIKSAPYGELNDILRDLQKISQVDLSSQYIIDAVQEYNEEHLTIFGQNSPDKIIAMESNRIGRNQYINQYKKTIYTVDHLNQHIIDSQPIQIDMVQPVMELLNQLNIELTKYAKKYYRQPFGHMVHIQVSQDIGVIVNLGLTGKNVNLGNYYAGEWVSNWRVTKQSLKGTIKIKAHFFEGGNVQLQDKKDIDVEFQFSKDLGESAKNIIKLIERYQCETQSGIEAVYQDMPSKFFKNLRRFAPYTQTKMNWNINAIKMNQNLMQYSEKNK